MYTGLGGEALLPPRRALLHVHRLLRLQRPLLVLEEGVVEDVRRRRRDAHPQPPAGYELPEELAGLAGERRGRIVAVLGEGAPQGGVGFGVPAARVGRGGRPALRGGVAVFFCRLQFEKEKL